MRSQARRAPSIFARMAASSSAARSCSRAWTAPPSSASAVHRTMTVLSGVLSPRGSEASLRMPSALATLTARPSSSSTAALKSGPISPSTTSFRGACVPSLKLRAISAVPWTIAGTPMYSSKSLLRTACPAVPLCPRLGFTLSSWLSMKRSWFASKCLMMSASLSAPTGGLSIEPRAKNSFHESMPSPSLSALLNATPAEPSACRPRMNWWTSFPSCFRSR
mmetsp:Transcript_31028/g.85503  ORF Transcript_31028/g.85503 Transcript_31028/m.85503 type:complete len:221 (-) Transcript_31028:2128-2790(-)